MNDTTQAPPPEPPPAPQRMRTIRLPPPVAIRGGNGGKSRLTAKAMLLPILGRAFWRNSHEGVSAFNAIYDALDRVDEASDEAQDLGPITEQQFTFLLQECRMSPQEGFPDPEVTRYYNGRIMKAIYEAS